MSSLSDLRSQDITRARGAESRRRAWPAAWLAAFALPLALALAPTALAQSEPAFEPEVGSAGKDVVWVPTPQSLVDRMLDIAKVTPQDTLIDLGSGDGRTVITAAKRGVRAYGIEYNPDMVALSRRRAAEAGVAERATFQKADLFETDFSFATVVTMFLLEDINIRLRPKILDMKPGTRVVSNTFTMGDWQADETSTVGDCSVWCTALKWIVPAKVGGTWRLGARDLKLEQKYQMLTGSLGASNIAGGKMNGAQISFTVDGAPYTGTVAGNTMTGTSPGGNWTATRR